MDTSTIIVDFGPNKAFLGLICGLCRHFHRLSCMAESPESYRQKQFFQGFFSKPLNPRCFEVDYHRAEGTLKEAINRFEHEKAMEILGKVLMGLRFPKDFVRHVETIEFYEAKDGRQKYIVARIHFAKEFRLGNPIERLFYIRNFKSREVEAEDIPRCLKRLNLSERHGKWGPRFVLMAPQLPSEKDGKLEKECERLGIELWELGFAYSIPDRKVKWERRDQKRLQEIQDENEFYMLVFGAILGHLRRLAGLILRLLKTWFPNEVKEAERTVSLWYEKGLDPGLFSATDRGPPMG
jgi:hypothetical protein